MSKCQSKLRKYLVTAYENKVKGVMDDETTVLPSNQFKRERDRLQEKRQRIQAKFVTAQKSQNGHACFEKEDEDHDNIKFLTWDMVG